MLTNRHCFGRILEPFRVLRDALRFNAAIAFLALGCGCASAPDKSPTLAERFALVLPGNADAENTAQAQPAAATTITQAELQDELMDFADQYTQMLFQAADDIRSAKDLPLDVRAAATYAKVLYAASALKIATGPRPAANLLDMVTFINLGLMAVEDYWVPQVYGPAGQTLLEGYRRMDAEAWSIAGQFLNPAQLRELREIILRWRRENPQQRYVSDIRLLNFAKLQGSAFVTDTADSEGLVDNIEDAVENVDETLLLAERVMFYLQKLPALITLETELLLEQIALSPAVAAILDDTNRLTATAERAVALVGQLPGQISAERQATVDQLTTWLSSEEQQLRGLLGDVQQTLATGNTLVNSVDKTVGTLDTFMGQLNPAGPETPKPPGRPFDIREYTETVEKAILVMGQLAAVVASVEKLLAAAPLERRVQQIFALLEHAESTSTELMERAAVLVLAVFFAVLLGSVAAALLYRFLAGRIGRPRSESASETAG